MNIAEKLISSHLVSGVMKPGQEIAISIDQTLTQDATGTMAYLEFEALGLPKVTTKLSVSYVDHNTLQTGFENADDHRFLQSIASRYGLYFSKPGNGICHQVHLERFAKPGQTLLGSDSHTPNAGALGMLAIGAGGLSVAMAMAGEPFYMVMPKIVRINLNKRLSKYTTAKDIILEVLKRLTVKGGVGKIIEYAGSGLKQQRAKDWRTLLPDPDTSYDEELNIELDKIEPLIAAPSSPDNVMTVKKIAGMPVRQVCIGSCVNSSLMDLMLAAKILKGKTVHPDVSLTISPGSRQVFLMISKNGAMTDLIASGARMLECACGPCIGMGQAPPTDAVSLRTFNRNFPGRSGTKNDKVYLCSPLTAAVSAITGKLTNPKDYFKRLTPHASRLTVKLPEKFIIDDSLIIPPSKKPKKVVIQRGPNIKPLPVRGALEESLKVKVLLKAGDNITTDDIIPAGSKILSLRSNIPALSEYVFSRIDSTFPSRAKTAGSGVVLGGMNYGQGSSREHAALAPMYLGVKVVLAKSFARIHMDNLINFGVLPLTIRPEGYDSILQDDEVEFPNLAKDVKESSEVTLIHVKTGSIYKAAHNLSERQRKIILAGGLLNFREGK
ncbi:MAG: aconitate hydratase [Nitrospirae bacterium]|nr:aconitate hydratase [Nitrospirota bacterium]